MIPYMMIQALSEDETEKIHSAMVSILSRTGLAVEHRAVREAFAEYGAQVDHETERVRFPAGVIERFIDETQPIANSLVAPSGAGEPGCVCR